MGNCLVEKLKVTVNNPDLPVFQSVVLKDYATTSVDNQYVDLSSIISLFKHNEFRYLAFDAEFVIVDKTATMAAFNTRNHVIGSALLSENVKVGEVAIVSRNTVQTVSASNNTLYAVTYRPERTGSVYIAKTSINDVEYTSTDYLMGGQPFQNYSIDHICAFGYSTNSEFTTFTSKAGALKLKSIKIYDYNDVSYSKIAEIVPAIVNGIPCLYDTMSEQMYTPNTGSLVVE